MRFNRSAVVLTTAAASLLLLATPALAHVTVQGPGATQGGFTKLTFRVPTERDVATTKLEVQFPLDAPLVSVSIKPHLGWTAVVEKAKPAVEVKGFDGKPLEEVVSTITWTSTGDGIMPGEFDEFDVSAGPLPKVDAMVFKALQTYKDGEVVRWIETGTDPEHPAPTLKLAPAADSATPSASATASPAATVTAAAEEEDDDVLSYGALAVAVLALLLGLGAFVRSGRRPTA